MIKYILFLFLTTQCFATQYKAIVVRVLDADTFNASIYLGLDVIKMDKIRINGIDAPELKTLEGKEAQKFLQKLIEGKEVLIDTNEDRREKYGRLLCKVTFNNQDIAQLLIKKGIAKEYHGGKRG